jgi:hypothetical protein
LEPDFFAEDFKFLRYLGESTGLREVGLDLLSFRDANLGKPSFWRTSLRIRVSGRKASRLARQLFVAEKEADLPNRLGRGIAVGT